MKSGFYRKNEYNDEYLGLRQTKALLGIFAIGIIFHHVALKVDLPFNPFRGFGYLFVSYFFFCSGFGLCKSFLQKENYLSGFLKKHLLPIFSSFLLADILFQIERIKRGAFAFPANTYCWFILAIIAFYIAFYLCFRFFKTRALMGLLIWTVCWCAVCKSLSLDSYWYNAVPAFPLGVAFAKHYDSATQKIKKSYPVFLITALLASVVLHFLAVDDMRLFGMFGSAISFNWIKEIQSVLQIFSALAFTLLITLLSLKFEIKNKVLDFLGGMTLEIYLTHVLFVELFSRRFINAYDPLFYIKNPFLYLLVVLVLTIPLAFLIALFRKKVLPWLLNAPFFLWAVKVFKKILFIAAGLFVFVTIYYTITSHMSTSKNQEAVQKYKEEFITLTPVEGKNMAAYVTGQGQDTVVILSDLSDPCPSMTMRPLAQSFAQKYKVIVPDMFGYGFSDAAESPRTAENITKELHELIEKINGDKPVIFFAYHEAGVYAEVFIKNYRNQVKALYGYNPVTWEILSEHYDNKAFTQEQIAYETRRSETRAGNRNLFMKLTGFIRIQGDDILEVFKTGPMKEYLAGMEEMLIEKNAGKASVLSKANILVDGRNMTDFILPSDLSVVFLCSKDADSQLDPSPMDLYETILQNPQKHKKDLFEANDYYIYYKPEFIVERIEKLALED